MLATTRALKLAAPLAVGCLVALHGVPAEAKSASRTKTVISFNEIFAEDPASASGKLHVEARIPVTAADTAAFDATTPFDVSAGFFDFSGVLGDDPSYFPGSSSATLTEEALDGSGRVLVAKLRWTEKQLTVRITCVTGDDISPVIADTYSMEDSTAVYDNLDAQLTLGSVTAAWDPLLCVGHVYTWSWRGEGFSIVRMHGRAAY
jgi:hypothetical protein